jgi:hypothetical protein
LTNYSNVISDQPKLGVCDDKVVVSWNDYPNGASFSGSETEVLQKSTVLSGTIGSVVVIGPDSTLFSIVPSQSLSSTTTEWLASNKRDRIAVLAISGTPNQSNVVGTEYDLPIVSTFAPPDARQPSGPAISTSDDRYQSAVWRNGALWTSGDDRCFPASDVSARSCLRLTQVLTGSSPAVGQDFDGARIGTDVYYPAVTTDRYGDLFVAYSASSPNMNASVFGVVQPVNTPINSLGNTVAIQTGLGSYNFDGSSNPQRWGDYSAAAIDPTNSADVWLTGEYAASSTAPSNWGTATATVAMRPIVSSTVPSSGPASGGQSVTVSGNYFQSGAAVSFDAAMASGVMVADSTRITATTPPGFGGADVTVTNPDGTSGSAGSAYTYWEPLGGGLGSAPDAASWGTGRLDVFARGPSNDVQHKWYAGAWSGWESLGGQTTSGPGVIAWGPGRLDVFVQGTDNGLWHKWYAGGWSGWESLGGQLMSGPDAASWSEGRLDVFARGTDNALWHKWYAGGWSGWESLGGSITADPSAVSWNSGRIDLFVRGTDIGLWHKWYAGGWSGWESLGGALGSGPDAGSTAPGLLDVFALATDNSAQRQSFSGQWTGWRNIGGQWTSDPSAVSQHNGTVDLFERDSANGLWHTALRSP